MGRPPLNIHRVTINIPEDLLQWIDHHIRPQKRRQFVTEMLRASQHTIDAAEKLSED